MKCEECFLLLEEYVENELDDQQTLSVVNHLNACVNCADRCADLRREWDVYGDYLADIEATPALWVNLRGDFEAHHQRRTPLFEGFKNTFGAIFQNPEYIAASLILIIIAGVGLLKYRQTEPVSDPTIASFMTAPAEKPFSKTGDSAQDARAKSGGSEFIRTKDTGPKRPVQTVLAKQTAPVKDSQATPKRAMDETVAKLESHYTDAIKLLARDIKNQRKPLSAQTRALIEQSDQAIKATRRILESKPRDPVVIQYVRDAYEKKVDLLRLIATR